MESKAPLMQNETIEPKPQRKNRVFPIVLGLLVVAGAWFGISKYTHSLHHEETDDAQIEANISPVLPRVSGFVAEGGGKDKQQVKKGDTLLVLDSRDLQLKVDQAEAALATAKSNLGAARSGTTAATANI